MMYILTKVTNPDTGETMTGLSLERDGVVYGIPQQEGNRHYEEYLVWLSEGNEPEVIENV